jgi:hypothetical protein
LLSTHAIATKGHPPTQPKFLLEQSTNYYSERLGKDPYSIAQKLSIFPVVAKAQPEEQEP